jgi:hypothetical protein
VRQLQNILYEIVLYCAVLYVIQRVYLYNIESINRRWKTWITIKASNSTIGHLTVITDSQGYTKYRVLFAVVFVFRNQGA